MKNFKFAAVLALLCNAAVDVLAFDECPQGEYSVSILGDSQNFRCVPVRPCSGKYKTSGMEPVGGCPPGTACALLPFNPDIMGCVDAGRTDVTYVLPDGTLSDGPLNPGTSTGSSTGSSAGSNANSGDTDGSTTKGSGSTGSSLSSSSGSLSGSRNSTDSISSRESESDPLNATDPASSSAETKKKDEQGGVNLTSSIFIVVGVLAVVAVIAGIRLLKKRKEPAGPPVTSREQPYGAGNGVMTPKENVLLL